MEKARGKPSVAASISDESARNEELLSRNEELKNQLERANSKLDAVVRNAQGREQDKHVAFEKLEKMIADLEEEKEQIIEEKKHVFSLTDCPG